MKKKTVFTFGFLALAAMAFASTGNNNSSSNGNTGGNPSSIDPNTIPTGGVPPGDSEGSVNESFLGMGNLPRGIRNNNPGNIKISSSNWQHKILPQYNLDGTFEQFESFAWGTRAMIKLLQNYMAQGRDSVDTIIDYWSVGNPNYKAYIINRTGFSLNQTLQPDKPTLEALTKAMSYFENGEEIMTTARFNTGYGLV